jgi:hypothetical protein
VRYALTHVFPGSPYRPHELVPKRESSTTTTSSRSHLLGAHIVAWLLRVLLTCGRSWRTTTLHQYNNNTTKMATIADLATAYGITVPSSADLPKNTNRGDGLCIMTWAMLGVATVLVAGRVMSKILVLRKFGLDDAFLLLTWV